MLFCDHLNEPSGVLRHQNSPTEFLTTSFSFVQTWLDKFSGVVGWFEVGCGVGVATGVGVGVGVGVGAGVGAGVGLVFEEADFTVTPLLQTNFLPFFWHV